MTREEILSVLLRWNTWGKNREKRTFPREHLKRILSLKDYHGVVVIKGPRRAGKSTLLYQIMEVLSKERETESLLYVNFEDYAFSSEELTPKTLEAIVDVYKQEIYRGNDFLLFLDEIQNVNEWHRWIRTAVDSGLIRTAFVTGSSSKLLSGELATLLTGRHIDFEVLPFSFKEYVAFRGANPTRKLDLIANKDKYISLLVEYLTYGGFPEVVSNVEDKRLVNSILSHYAEDIVLKDVATRYEVENLKLLKILSKLIPQNTGNRLSIRKLQRHFESIFGKSASTTTISNYISYLESAYFCFEVPSFDFSIKKISKKPAKYYLIDTGLRNIISPSFTSDRGRLLENAIYLKLKSMYEEIYYWEGKNEIDFVCKKGKDLVLYNVSYVSQESEVKERELRGFVEFPFPVGESYLITWDLRTEISLDGVKIKAVPAYLFLLEKID